MATPKDILQDIRDVVANVGGISRVNSSRKNDAPASGQYSASVLYPGEEITLWVINNGSARNDHVMPVTIEVRTSQNSDDDLIDKIYSILDAVLSPSNKPTDCIWIKPDSVDEPEGEGYLTAVINLNVRFRRTPSFIENIRIDADGNVRVTSTGDTRVALTV